MTGDNLDIKQFDTKIGRKEIRIVRCFLRERQSYGTGEKNMFGGNCGHSEKVQNKVT